jgi:hypothetical protein
MKTFKQFICEAVKKNSNIQHWEDMLWTDGSSAVNSILEYSNDILDYLKSNSTKKINATVKVDGSPALICGINPDNKQFFVGTKSVFAKNNPKVCYTNSDIENFYPEVPGLVKILKLALKYLPEIGIKGILQGDIMFIPEFLKVENIDGSEYLTFTPNTITYAIPKDSQLYNDIVGKKVGIFFHSEYVGSSFDSLKLSMNPNLSRLKKSKNVWFDDVTIKNVAGKATFTKQETNELQTLIDSVNKEVSFSGKFLDSLPSTFSTYAGAFANAQVRLGKIKDLSVEDFISFYKSKKEESIEKLKTDSGKEKSRNELNVYIEYLIKNKKYYNSIFNIFTMLISIKEILYKKFQELDNLKTFIKYEDGYKVSKGEGFVITDNINKRTIKLVDRLEFSRINFAKNR